MARAHFRYTLDDGAGNVIANARVYVYTSGTTTDPGDVYSVPTGGSPVASLVSNSYGEIEGWKTSAASVSLKITDNSHAATRFGVVYQFADRTVNVEIYPIPEDLGTGSGGGGGGGTGGATWDLNFTYDVIKGLELDIHKTPTGTPPVNGWPLMVLFHGGGPEGGNRSAVYGIGDDLAAVGILCASVDYSTWSVFTQPNAMFPEPELDAVTAVEWLKTNNSILGLGFDPTKIGALGESWGGHHAAYLGLVRNPGDTGRVKLWVTMSGIHDFKKYIEDPTRTAPTKKAMYEHVYGGPAAPVTTVGAQLSPGGVNPGDHQYLLTLKKTGVGETTYTQIKFQNVPAVTGGNTGYHVTVTFPALPPGIAADSWVIYRARGVGSIFRKVAEVAAGTASYDDIRTDVDIQGASIPPTSDTSGLSDFASDKNHVSATSAPGYLANGKADPNGDPIPPYEAQDTYNLLIAAGVNASVLNIVGLSDHGIQLWGDIKNDVIAWLGANL